MSQASGTRIKRKLILDERCLDERNKAMSECKVLRDQIDQYSKIDYEAKEEKVEMERQISILNEVIFKQKHCIQEAKKEQALSSSLRNQNELQASLKIQEDLRNELEASKSEHEVTNIELNKCQQENTLLKQEIIDLNLKNIELKRSDSERCLENENLVNEKEDALIQLNQAKDEVQDALKSKDDLLSKFSTFNSEYDQMSSSFLDKNTEIRKLKDDVDKLKSNISHWDNMELSYKQTIVERNQIIQQIEKEKTGVVEKYKKLQIQLQGSLRRQEELARKLGLKHYHAKCDNLQDNKLDTSFENTLNNGENNLDQKPDVIANSNTIPVESTIRIVNQCSSESITLLKDELENLRWYCYGKEKELDTLEHLKEELLIQDCIKEKKISLFEEELKAKDVKICLNENIMKEVDRKEKALMQSNETLKKEKENLKNQLDVIKQLINNTN